MAGDRGRKSLPLVTGSIIVVRSCDLDIPCLLDKSRLPDAGRCTYNNFEECCMQSWCYSSHAQPSILKISNRARSEKPNAK